MKNIIFLFFFIFGAFVNSDWRIISGKPAEEGQFPYQVFLRYLGAYYCGGSILDETTIICAAHCVIGTPVDYLEVVLGTNQLNDPNAIRHKIKSYIVHEEYDIMNYSNDISLIKLSEPIKFNNKAQPLPLPTSNIGIDEVILSGWGSIGSNIPNDLQFIHLKTITSEECDKDQSFPISEKQVCTSTENGEGTCNGDAGSPLVDLEGKHVGIVSWGSLCGKGSSDVYTRIYAYLDWIEDNRH